MFYDSDDLEVRFEGSGGMDERSEGDSDDEDMTEDNLIIDPGNNREVVVEDDSMDDEEYVEDAENKNSQLEMPEKKRRSNL